MGVKYGDYKVTGIRNHDGILLIKIKGDHTCLWMDFYMDTDSNRIMVFSDIGEYYGTFGGARGIKFVKDFCRTHHEENEYFLDKMHAEKKVDAKSSIHAVIDDYCEDDDIDGLHDELDRMLVHAFRPF